MELPFHSLVPRRIGFFSGNYKTTVSKVYVGETMHSVLLSLKFMERSGISTRPLTQSLPGGEEHVVSEGDRGQDEGGPKPGTRRRWVTDALVALCGDY